MPPRSCVYAAVLFGLLAFLGAPNYLRAQPNARITSSGGLFEAGIASAAIDGYARSSLGDLAASFWGARDRLSGDGTASVTRFESGSATGYGELNGAWSFSSEPRDLSAFKVRGGGGSYRGSTSSRHVEASAVIGREYGGGTAAWVAAGLGSSGNMKMHGTTHAAGGVSIGTAISRFDGTVSYSAVSSFRYADVLLSARLAPFGHPGVRVPRFVAGLDAGVRIANFTPGRTAWVAGTAMLHLAGPVEAVAYAGAQPADLMRATPGAALTSLAVRVALGRASSASKPEFAAPRAISVGPEGAGGQRTVTVLLQGANRVELMADFTNWLPVPMHRVAPGIWQARLPMTVGSHRINVRTDSGAWRAPPGIPVTDDDFGGRVGILTVP